MRIVRRVSLAGQLLPVRFAEDIHSDKPDLQFPSVAENISLTEPEALPRKYLLVNIVRVTVRFVQPQLQRDRLCLRKRDAFKLSAFVHCRGIVGQRDVT